MDSAPIGVEHCQLCGSLGFSHIFDIASGDRIEERVHTGITGCTELICLLTPWSAGKNWVWSEMAGAWILRKRYVAVLYGLTIGDIDREHGGLAILSPTRIIDLNDFDTYLRELGTRVKEVSHD
jgi:hypothetical protein